MSPSTSLQRVGGHEEVAAVALVVVLRRGLIMDRSLRDLGLRLAARQREQGRGACGGEKNGAAADAGCVASLAHERLLRRRDHLARRHWLLPANRSAQFRMILNWRVVNRRRTAAGWRMSGNGRAICAHCERVKIDPLRSFGQRPGWEECWRRCCPSPAHRGPEGLWQAAGDGGFQTYRTPRGPSVPNSPPAGDLGARNRDERSSEWAEGNWRPQAQARGVDPPIWRLALESNLK